MLQYNNRQDEWVSVCIVIIMFHVQILLQFFFLPAF